MFDLSTDTIAGKATHQIVGGPAGLDETIYARLRVAGRRQCAGRIGLHHLPQLGSRPIELLGIDPFAEEPFRSYLAAERSGSADNPAGIGQLVTFLTRPGALLISEGLAEDYNLSLGDTVEISAAGRPSTGFIAGLLRPDDRLARRALEGIVLADIATAQETLGQAGRLSHIDLIVPADGSGLDAIRALLPEDARVIPVSARTGAVEQMTAAFRTNLTALSLLALVVGMFLIYNTMTFSVVQRRPLFGSLRCLGVTRRRWRGWCWVRPPWSGCWVLRWAWDSASCSARAQSDWSRRRSTTCISW